ncbi:hypothetical protein [Massilia putida]|uniref:hypothetical protein n=1 Tax=Massilia putida TaxID=1141883 RepID=UPI0009512577|nr:hypothetical protein [Massilia putida]
MNDSDQLTAATPKRGRLASTHYQWGFHLNGNEHWLESFTNFFTSVDIAIIANHEDDRPTTFDFTSTHLNGLTGVQAAMRARELLTLFNGVMQLREGDRFRPFRIGEGYDFWSHARARVDYFRTVPVPMFPDDVENLRYLRHSQRKLDPTSKQLFLARSDRYLRTIFRTLGREGVSFVALSKVQDTIAAHLQLSGKKATRAELAALGDKTASDVENFDWTANNFDVAGEDARHGLNAKFKPSTRLRALTLEEAADVMFPIIRGFVRERVDQTFDQQWEAVLIDNVEGVDPPIPRPEDTRPDYRPG